MHTHIRIVDFKFLKELEFSMYIIFKVQESYRCIIGICNQLYIYF